MKYQSNVARTLHLVFLLLFLIATPGIGHAETIAPLPDLGLVKGGTVYATTVQPDGKVIIGGDFTIVNGVERRYLARLNADGTLDESWNPDANNTVLSLLFDNTNLYVGGYFSIIGGQSRYRFARLDAVTGHADSWNPASNNAVSSMVLDEANRKIYVGGLFTTIGGQSRNRLARLDTTTGLADTWNPDANNLIRTMVREGSNLYVGGTFTSIGGQTRNYIARLNTTTGLPDTWVPNISGPLYKIALDGTRLYVGGAFGYVDGLFCRALASLNTTTGLGDGWCPGPYNHVRTLLLDNGSVYIGGLFGNVGGTARSYLARIDTTTALVDSWNPGANHHVYSLAFANDGSILAGGQFTEIGGNIALAFSKIDNSGVRNGNFDVHVGDPGNVYAMEEASDGSLYVGGWFARSNDVNIYNLLRVSPNGTLDETWAPNPSGYVRDILLDGTELYVGGVFVKIDGQTRYRIARLDTATGNVDGWNPHATGGHILSMALGDSNNHLYVGGSFTGIGGQARNRIARLDTITGNADNWNPNANNAVFTMVLDKPNLHLYAGGTFTEIDGQPRSRIARFDTSTGEADSWQPNAGGAVLTMAHDAANDKLYVGGQFTAIAGVSRHRIARLKTTVDTSQLEDWNPQAGHEVHALALDGANDKIYVGGTFLTIGGQNRSRIARLDTTIDTNQADDWNPGANNIVNSLFIAGSSAIYAGGGFSTIGDQYRLGFAKIVEDTEGPITSNVLANPNPMAVATPITISANVDDTTTGGSLIAGASYTLNGGMATAMAASDGAFDEAVEDVTATIADGLLVGVYDVCVSGADVIGNIGAEECSFLAVYDPSAGFVTGGGWINSPPGAYVPDPTLVGKANFGFVAKYKRGQTIPDGNTEFQFKAGDLKFKSTDYEWLVIANAKGMFKGSGTINGAGNYGFMLSAIDAALTPSTDVDLFRIKIWDKDSGDVVIYDNNLGAGDGANPTTILGGGSIVIHSGNGNK